ncbi:permease-like cell division protein FtsX [Candidatus Soleaferrea massiliensis]|uniref:permease-like cell division protein FtsX n=1 Tax=Candidatus Soleaferrea massiliensis TaxID=1470354 RepID=UPI00058D855D|nr:permease-like cell division protein FtsX [Candidatus Soleaferrea massiliensis]
MKGSSFTYLIKEGAKNIWNNRLMSFASVGVMVACLLIVGAAMLFSINVNSFVGYVESQNEVVVFLDDDVTDQEIEDLRAQLGDNDNLSGITFVSKEEALLKEMENMGDAAALFDGLFKDNPLPDKFVVQLKNLEYINDTVRDIEHLKGVESTQAPRNVADMLVNIRYAVSFAGSFIILILAVVTLIIIANTIKLTVFSRRTEINIMKYVGATDSFIRLPFIAEGIILGLISAIVSFFILWGAYNWLMSWLIANPQSWLQSAYGSFVPFTQMAWPLFGGFALGGSLIGVLGSFVFVRKHLRV